MQVVVGMNYVSIHLGEQARHKRFDIAASARERSFPDVLSLVPLEDNPGATPRRMLGQPQVRVQDGTRPPLENQHGWTLTV